MLKLIADGFMEGLNKSKTFKESKPLIKKNNISKSTMNFIAEKFSDEVYRIPVPGTNFHVITKKPE